MCARTPSRNQKKICKQHCEKWRRKGTDCVNFHVGEFGSPSTIFYSPVEEKESSPTGVFMRALWYRKTTVYKLERVESCRSFEDALRTGEWGETWEVARVIFPKQVMERRTGAESLRRSYEVGGMAEIEIGGLSWRIVEERSEVVWESKDELWGASKADCRGALLRSTLVEPSDRYLFTVKFNHDILHITSTFYDSLSTYMLFESQYGSIQVLSVVYPLRLLSQSYPQIQPGLGYSTISSKKPQHQQSICKTQMQTMSLTCRLPSTLTYTCIEAKASRSGCGIK